MLEGKYATGTIPSGCDVWMTSDTPIDGQHACWKVPLKATAYAPVNRRRFSSGSRDLNLNHGVHL